MTIRFWKNKICLLCKKERKMELHQQEICDDCKKKVGS